MLLVRNSAWLGQSQAGWWDVERAFSTTATNQFREMQNLVGISEANKDASLMLCSKATKEGRIHIYNLCRHSSPIH